MVLAPGGRLHSLTDASREILQGLPAGLRLHVPGVADRGAQWHIAGQTYSVRSVPLPPGSLLSAPGAMDLEPCGQLAHLADRLALPKGDPPDWRVVLIESHSSQAAATERLYGLGLTARQEQVAALLLQGRSYKEIARICDVAPATAKEHMAAVYRKLWVRSRAEFMALVLGIEMGDPDVGS